MRHLFYLIIFLIKMTHSLLYKLSCNY